MIAKSCKEEEVTHNSTEDLRKNIEALRVSLENAFTEYEQDKELVRNPQVWVTFIEDGIKRALCFLEQRKNHPGLEEVFAKLEASYQRADGRLPRYGKRMKLPGF